MNPLVLYFLFTTVVVAYLMMRVEGAVLSKVIVLTVMFYISSAIWFSFSSYKGWPTDRPATEDAVIMSVVIFDKTKSNPGAIYVTAIPCSGSVSECQEYSVDDGLLSKLSPYKVFGYVPKARNTPKLFEFPYTEANRKAFSEARDNIANGGRSTMKGMKGKQGEGKGDGSGQPTGIDKAGMNGGPDGQENASIDDAPMIVNEGPQDLLRKD